jgi:hypothetical protein
MPRGFERWLIVKHELRRLWKERVMIKFAWRTEEHYESAKIADSHTENPQNRSKTF